MLNFPCVLALACCAPAWAGESADLAAIQALIDELNTTPATAQARLFTAGANAAGELKRLSEMDRRLSNGPWSEVTAPKIRCRSVRFITPDVALVDAENTQYGSVILVRRIPVLLVVRKEHGNWRIAALRIFAGQPGCRGSAPREATAPAVG